jgi:hypothetical protein
MLEKLNHYRQNFSLPLTRQKPTKLSFALTGWIT